MWSPSSCASACEVAACPLAAALSALQKCSSQSALEETVAWLSGQSKAGAEMKTCLKAPAAALRHRRNRSPVQLLLTGISLLATLAGYNGMAVLVDESEHYSLLRHTARRGFLLPGDDRSALGLNNGRIDPRDQTTAG